MSSDPLGRLSIRHLALCAIHTPNDDKSRELARIISDAVDFPKTGVPPVVSKVPKIDVYPVFMEVKNKKSLRSPSSLEILYEQVKEVWEIHSKWIEMMDEKQIQIDPQFLLPKYEQYVTQADYDHQYYSSRMDTILLTYNLVDEYELITGCHSYREEELKNNDSVETSLLEYQRLLQDMRNRFMEDRLK